MLVTNCSLCWLSEYIKNGFVRWVRRYKCKVCWNNFLESRKKRVSIIEKVKMIERYLKWESITSITKTYIWYSIVWIWKHINFFKKSIKNFDKVRVEMKKTPHYFNIVEIDTYKRYIENERIDYWYCILDWKYWLVISPNRVSNSYLIETIKPNNIESYDEFCLKYGSIFKN